MGTCNECFAKCLDLHISSENLRNLSKEAEAAEITKERAKVLYTMCTHEAAFTFVENFAMLKAARAAAGGIIACLPQPAGVTIDGIKVDEQKFLMLLHTANDMAGMVSLWKRLTTGTRHGLCNQLLVDIGTEPISKNVRSLLAIASEGRGTYAHADGKKKKPMQV